MPNRVYTLEILDTQVLGAEGDSREIVVTYQGHGHGHGGPAEVRRPLEAVDLDGILACCEGIAQAMFHAEFRLNDKVDVSFSLRDENGMKIWHTEPGMFVKCPLTMAMSWSCLHLSQTYKTMTTLGMLELPAEYPLTGNAIGLNDTARVIMDSMASGLEFMGNVMLMRESVDHEALARQRLVAGTAAAGAAETAVPR